QAASGRDFLRCRDKSLPATGTRGSLRDIVGDRDPLDRGGVRGPQPEPMVASTPVASSASRLGFVSTWVAATARRFGPDCFRNDRAPVYAGASRSEPADGFDIL